MADFTEQEMQRLREILSMDFSTLPTKMDGQVQTAAGEAMAQMGKSIAATTGNVASNFDSEGNFVPPPNSGTPAAPTPPMTGASATPRPPPPQDYITSGKEASGTEPVPVPISQDINWEEMRGRGTRYDPNEDPTKAIEALKEKTSVPYLEDDREILALRKQTYDAYRSKYGNEVLSWPEETAADFFSKVYPESGGKLAEKHFAHWKASKQATEAMAESTRKAMQETQDRHVAAQRLQVMPKPPEDRWNRYGKDAAVARQQAMDRQIQQNFRDTAYNEIMAFNPFLTPKEAMGRVEKEWQKRKEAFAANPQLKREYEQKMMEKQQYEQRVAKTLEQRKQTFYPRNRALYTQEWRNARDNFKLSEKELNVMGQFIRGMM